MFKSKMNTPPTPERVYTLCKLVEKESRSNNDLREIMEPGYLGKKTIYYAEYRNVAEELGLISNSSNMVSLEVSPENIRTIYDFRRFVIGEIERFSDGPFYKLTNAFYSLDIDVLKRAKNLATLAQFFSEKINTNIDAPAMRAWRFWAAFLGFGYLQEVSNNKTNESLVWVLPNAAVFLKDVIKIASIEKNHKYEFEDFVAKIMPYAKIVLDTGHQMRVLNFGVSNGLRTLHDMGVIKLEYILDQQNTWTLYPAKEHLVKEVSHITIM